MPMLQLNGHNGASGQSVPVHVGLTTPGLEIVFATEKKAKVVQRRALPK